MPPDRPTSSERILPFSSSSGIYIPPRGESFFKFSYDFPEPSVEFSGLQLGFRLCTFENVYGLDREHMTVEDKGDSVELRCTQLVWAGGQEKAPGKLTARIRKQGPFVEWSAEAEMDQPIKSVTSIVRGVPRGEISAGGESFRDWKNDEVLFGYPFREGEFPRANGMPTPLAVVKHGEQNYFHLSTTDDKVRANRYFFQPGEKGYRVELVYEKGGWEKGPTLQGPRWRAGEASSLESACAPHFQHLEQTFHFPSWESRPDVPAWARETELIVFLWGVHWTGYIFNDYAKMTKILDWVATQFPAQRVLVFLVGWDGRYYWNYPLFAPDDSSGGPAGFRALTKRARGLGFHLMPMFGTNAANNRHPMFSEIADAATKRIDGDPFNVDWVDWDNDRHREGWMPYMNPGVASWREYLQGRILDIIDKYEVDSYYLDIVGGWLNNPQADMHEGTRQLVEAIRAKHPEVLACGEMYYDAQLAFIPLYIFASADSYPIGVGKYARAFQHWPSPGRGSSGCHESGFNRQPSLASIKPDPYAIPTVSFVDDTFDRYHPEMAKLLKLIKDHRGIS
jgi:hypothetical protein